MTPAARSFVMLTLLALLALLAGGCNVIGFAAGRVLPEPQRPPAYRLGQSAVGVEVVPAAGVYGERGPIDAETTAVAIESVLKSGTKANVVPPSRAERIILATLEPPSDRSLIASGRSSEGAAAVVRVLDADGAELFPNDGTPGRRVEVAPPPSARGASEVEVRRATLRALGLAVGGLFRPTTIEDD